MVPKGHSLSVRTMGDSLSMGLIGNQDVVGTGRVFSSGDKAQGSQSNSSVGTQDLAALNKVRAALLRLTLCSHWGQ